MLKVRYIVALLLISIVVLLAACMGEGDAPAEASELELAVEATATPADAPEAQFASTEVEDAAETAKEAPTEEPFPASGELTGIVQDRDGPIEAAVVRIRGTRTETISAADGGFSLGEVSLTEPISVTAWSAGYYIGAATAGPNLAPVTIEMTPYHTEDNLTYEFASAEKCSECHMAYAEWEEDAHGNSAVNPRFLSVYLGTDIHGNKGEGRYDASGRLKPPEPGEAYYGPGYRLDYPDRTGNCAACHTPAASSLESSNTCGWSGCHTSTTASFSDQVPYGVSPTGAIGVGLEGITCDFCHKIGEVVLDPETGLPWAAKPGISSMRVFRPDAEHDLFFGPFDDVPDPDSYLPLIEESAYCAPCHYGVFGGVAESHNVVGGVTIYNSYGEWLESKYSNPATEMTCQECHMPNVDYDHFVFPEKGGLSRGSDRIHNHLMPGVNDLNLMQNAVTMLASADLSSGRISVEVSVTNDNTGHHVPTGSPYRHVILLVTARDAKGETLALNSGDTLPAWIGAEAGQPGHYFAKIVKDEWSGEYPTATYWRDISLVEDTRLAAFETWADQYEFQATGVGPYQIHVQLLYRRAYQELMALKGWTEPDVLMEEANIELSE